ncbi:MAG: response regulator transcription factor [Candidatus Izemoplasmatales bacterium]|nr:response regulator transcription factor [Candidatus Izemoplasmatales bacterium]
MEHSILVIEDNTIVSQMVMNVLSREGFDVDIAATGTRGLEMFTRRHYSLVILDLLLPEISGEEILKTIRTSSQVPIIIISSKDTDMDKAIHLSLGADDYLTKPFSIVELIARVKAVLRRSQLVVENPNSVKQIGGLKIDLDNYEAFLDGNPLYLTLKEYLILKLFVTHPNHVFTKEHIYSKVWNEPYFENDNVINVHMRRLREKIEKDPSNPEIIKTIWGIGYKYEE